MMRRTVESKFDLVSAEYRLGRAARQAGAAQQSVTFRFQNFSVSKLFHLFFYGIGFEKFWFRKKYRYRFRKFLVSDKVLVSVLNFLILNCVIFQVLCTRYTQTCSLNPPFQDKQGQLKVGGLCPGYALMICVSHIQLPFEKYEKATKEKYEKDISENPSEQKFSSVSQNSQKDLRLTTLWIELRNLRLKQHHVIIKERG